ncbi:MAG TPA: hypothetical protein VGO52_01270 [Hyphomonadaceae bacterium]|nr:hypothetical protein [Hyphomonadaceae bacterium]
MARIRDLVGRVVTKPYALGSKSEREAVILQSKDGEYLLRRAGGNAMRDRQLLDLVGKTICVEGEVRDDLLIMTGWREAPDED